MKKRLIVVLLIVLVILGGIGGGIYIKFTRSILPGEVSKQVHFTVFYPANTQQFSVLKESIHYDSNATVLSYTVVIDDQKVAINQQAEPEAFKDAGTDAALYQKMLGSMQEYDEFDTNTGTVTLTHPKELKGGQAAVLDQKGTLLFAQPAKDLTKDQWKEFFNSLKVIHS